MIGWKSHLSVSEAESAKPKSFDDFELRLGDVMRGERATLGKSLLDVQRELRIKAAYIAAIENCDPGAFETPGFIAGYVRSYARYLNMDPDETFAAFCAESGFATAHGMSEKASSKRPDSKLAPASTSGANGLGRPGTPFAPVEDSFLSRIEPAAIGSLMVLVMLVGGIGYGGYSVLREVQRVQLAPVDQTPVVLSDLDPVGGVTTPTDAPEGITEVATNDIRPRTDALDRLYRPQALDVPVLVARDAPISTLDPTSVGVFAEAVQPQLPEIDTSSAVAQALRELTGELAPAPADGAARQIALVADRPAFVRVGASDGTVLFEGILNAGDTWEVPASAQAPIVRVGAADAVYFAVNGVPYGPARETGPAAEGLRLTEQSVLARYSRATPDALAQPTQIALARLSPPLGSFAALGQPRVLAESAPGVTILAAREAWVRVRSATGATIYEAIMQPGDRYVVPQTEQPPTIRTGDAGAIFFAVNGQTFGPFGGNGQVADNLALAQDVVTQRFDVADLTTHATLSKVVAELGGLSVLTTD